MKVKTYSKHIGVALGLLTSVSVFADEFSDLDTNHDGVISKEEFAAKNATTKKSDAVNDKTGVEANKADKEKKGGLIGWLESDFEIRESIFGANDKPPKDPAVKSEASPSANPAKLNWTKTKGANASYQVDAALLWKPSFLRGGTTIGSTLLGWYVQPSFEAHISTDPTASQNQLSYRTPLTVNIIPTGKDFFGGMDDTNASPKQRFITAHTVALSPTYQTDRNSGTRAIEAEIFYTPTIPMLASGIRQPVFNLENIQFRWRPYLGAELGNYLERDSATMLTTGSSIERLVARAEAELQLGDRYVISGSYLQRLELNGQRRALGYGEISGIVILDGSLPEKDKSAHFSVGVTYKLGKDAPDFNNVNEVSAWLGVRF